MDRQLNIADWQPIRFISWRGDAKLLKISIDEAKNQIVLRVEGKLIAPWTEELESAWQLIAKTLGERALRLDIRSTTFIDQNGLRILGKIIKTANTDVLADSPLTRQFAEQARQMEGNQERK